MTIEAPTLTDFAQALKPLYSGEVEQLLDLVNAGYDESFGIADYLMGQVRGFVANGQFDEAGDLARAVRMAQNIVDQLYPASAAKACAPLTPEQRASLDNVL